MKLLSQIRVLSENEMDRIFDGALDIVKSISMQVRHVKMLQILHDYGCKVDMEKQRVRFPMTVLQNLLDDIEKQKAKAREAPVDDRIKLSYSASGQALWAPEILDRRNVGGWLEDPKTMVDNAKEKVREILLHAENRSPLDEHQKREVTKLLKKADQELGSAKRRDLQ